MRLPDWDTRLARWATARVGEPFVWGQSDCVLLCFEAYDAMTGADTAATYRGRWHSKSSATRKQAEWDVTWLARDLRSRGCIDVKAGLQQRGDFVVVEKWPVLHAHVCFGDKCLSSSPRGGTTWGKLNFAVPDGLLILRIP